MFLQASVCPQGGGVFCLSAGTIPLEQTHPPLGADIPQQTPLPRADTTPKQTSPGADTTQSRHSPPEQTPPRADTPQSRHPPEQTPPHLGADTPPKQTPPRADTPPEQTLLPDMATAADGTHPTGMHSCIF